MKPDSPKPPIPKPPGVAKVEHDAQGKGILNWAAVTARHIGLSASQVLRKLDHSGLSLEDTTAPRGKQPVHQKPMPGGGVNPYERRPLPQAGLERRRATVIEGPGGVPLARGPAAHARVTSRASVPARPSWWRRLFRRG